MIGYKGKESADYGALLARPHYEAAITDLANMYDWQPKKLRELIKRKLILTKIIKRSTTEFSENELKSIANRLSAFYFQQAESDTPEDLNLNQILFTSGL